MVDSGWLGVVLTRKLQPNQPNQPPAASLELELGFRKRSLEAHLLRNAASRLLPASGVAVAPVCPLASQRASVALCAHTDEPLVALDNGNKRLAKAKGKATGPASATTATTKRALDAKGYRPANGFSQLQLSAIPLVCCAHSFHRFARESKGLRSLSSLPDRPAKLLSSHTLITDATTLSAPRQRPNPSRCERSRGSSQSRLGEQNPR